MLNIKELRDRLGISQELLAEETGLKRANIAKWEAAGVPPPKAEDYNKLVTYFTKRGLLQSKAFLDTNWQARYLELLEKENDNKQRLLESLSPSLVKLMEGQKYTQDLMKAHLRHEANVRAKGDKMAVQSEMEQISSILLELGAGKM